MFPMRFRFYLKMSARVAQRFGFTAMDEHWIEDLFVVIICNDVVYGPAKRRWSDEDQKARK